MENCKPISSPFNLKKNFKDSSDSSSSQVDEALYRSLLGSLMYLASSRLDILLIVNLLSRFMHYANSKQLSTTKHVLRYLKALLTLVCCKANTKSLVIGIF
jgi:hypothetical protein